MLESPAGNLDAGFALGTLFTFLHHLMAHHVENMLITANSKHPTQLSRVCRLAQDILCTDLVLFLCEAIVCETKGKPLIIHPSSIYTCFAFLTFLSVLSPLLYETVSKLCKPRNSRVLQYYVVYILCM